MKPNRCYWCLLVSDRLRWVTDQGTVFECFDRTECDRRLIDQIADRDARQEQAGLG